MCALPLDIQSLLGGRTVEWDRLELKAGWSRLDVLHTLCAFANDFHNLGGGYPILGVAERDGRPVLPPYHPIAVPYQIEGRHILVLWAPGGQSRCYWARTSLAKDSREQAWFIRKGSSTVKARGADETELLGLTATVPVDDRLNLQASVDDLDRDLMVSFLREVGSDLADEAERLPLAEMGRQMHVEGGTTEAPFPLNVGRLFFHPEPWRWFPTTQVDVVWFPDWPGGDRFTEKTFRGPVPRMVREALDYVRRNYVDETVTKHADRAEATRVQSFPFEAVEEAVVNAVYHRGYDVREPVEVRITPEDLVVLSYPGPDRSVRLEQLRAGRADPRRTATGGSVTGEVERLLAALDGEMSRVELQAKLDLRHEDHFRRAYLVPALDAGLVEMTIPDKPRSRLQRYRLTAAGTAWKSARSSP